MEIHTIKYDVQTPFNSGYWNYSLVSIEVNLHKNVLYINSMSATNRSEKRLRVKAARGIKKPPYYEDYKISSLVTVTIPWG